MAQRRGSVDPGVGASALQGFVTQLASAQQEQQKRRQAVAELVLGSRLKREEEAANPENLIKALGLQQALAAGRTVEPPGGFSRAEIEQPQLENVFAPVRREATTKVLERFGLIKPPTEDLVAQILKTEELSAARTRGTQSVQEQRDRQKAIAQAESRLRELETSAQGITSLFQSANRSVPPITGLKALPGVLPLAGLTRKAGLAAGTSERAKGFIATYPIEARKQLRTLEKGGRFTDKDVEQIILASTPAFDESGVARTSKQQELLRKIHEEQRTVLEQLAGLRGGESQAPRPPAQRGQGVLMQDANGNRALVFPDGTIQELR